ncbi:Retrotransposon-like protein 1 [Merluccius polli]|uniref:Retrotransposon-like protein 1 n=1 Tax=Merluccius polli TaxID=89951 RepID=A0AA47N865_MERPO|nr:Retrotransposon-like protein 1 [Merluccius polli]
MDPADTEAFRRAISHQQAQLGQHDQALQEITSSLRELSLSIASRLPVTPAPAVPVPSPPVSFREPFIPAPEPYGGDLGRCRSFLLQCSLVFELQPQTYTSDKARIAYLIGSLRGEALTWATAVWERGSAACSDYSMFTEEMRRVFDHPVRGREASQRLLLLKQGSRSVAAFAIEFRTLAVGSGWNEEALQGVFLNALGNDIKDELTTREESSDLEHLIALAIRMDNRLRERRRERASRSAPTPVSMPPAASRPPFPASFPSRQERRPAFESEAMQIGRMHLSPEEKERRILARASGDFLPAGASSCFWLTNSVL